MFAPITHFLPLTKIRRERLLPIAGKVFVHTGQKVSATDIIAEARITKQHILIDLADMLGIRSANVMDALKVTPSQVVSEGDILAGPVGVIPRVVRAPQAGKVVHYSKGQMLFEIENQPFQLRAGMEGVIRGIIADRGALIETTGALVQGVWGNGQLDQGALILAATNPRDELVPEMVDISMRGTIILAGHITRPETLKAIQQSGIRGVIVASIATNLVPLASQYTYPILVMDGFGRISMNSSAFKVLVNNEKREVAVNACVWDRYSDSRPEVVIPLPTNEVPDPPIASTVFSPGQYVRIVKTPLAGLVGKLIALRSEQTPIGNGLRVPAAVVNLENGDQTIVPLMNLDVIQ